MKISLLSGAYKNAGDFLIVKRCKELLKYVYPECEIAEYERRKPLEEHLKEINASDVLVMAGGPAYVEKLYPNIMPLTRNLDDIKVPIFAMAMGWNGVDNFPNTIYHYALSQETCKLLQRISADGYQLGCRDWYSKNVLKSNGIENSVMTGCAAWYNLPYVREKEIRGNYEIQRIGVSEPARTQNYGAYLELLKYLQKKFPKAEIMPVFHRGVGADQYTSDKQGKMLKQLSEKIKQLGMEIKDISYSADGFSIYDSCDLHIGYRVHAHIYNLSCRHKSILVEEDSRGAGVNSALGLNGIRSYKMKSVVTNNMIVKRGLRKFETSSEYVIKEIDDYIEQLEEDGYQEFKFAFERMNFYFEKMIAHLVSIKNGI